MLTTFRIFGLIVGFFICLQGRAQTSARHPSYKLLASGEANISEYVFNKSNVYSKADFHSLNISERDYGSLDELSKALCPTEFSELEKVRSIYFWVAKNIVYDELSLINNSLPSQQAQEVLDHKRAVCEGFSNLFASLCSHAGIEARIIVGYSKDEYNDVDKLLPFPNHAWNAVKINGKWRLLDVTWACFNRKVKNEQERPANYFKYKLESNFLIDPQLFIHSHLPEDPYWQLLPKPASSESFFSNNLDFEMLQDVDVHRRIDQLETLDSLDREIAYCERMVENKWNNHKEYRLGIAYYFKAQQLYRKLSQLKGRPKERMELSINKYYEKSLQELNKLSPMDFGFEYCKDLIKTIQSRKELLTIGS